MRNALLVTLALVLVSASACQSRFGRAMAFWHRNPSAIQVQSGAPAVGVRNALRQQVTQQVARQESQGAYDPRVGDVRLQNLEARIKLNPQDSAMHSDLAKIYESYGMDDLARDQFTRAFNLNPDSLEALQGLARLARQHPDEIGDVLPIARGFAERHENDPVALATLASLLDDTDDLIPAEKLYRKALQFEPRAAWLHNNLGFNLLLQSKLPEAAKELRHALELNPRSVTARNNLGVSLARQGDRNGALRVFQEAGADRASAHNNLAVALMEQDRLEESRTELLESLRVQNFYQPAMENFKLLLERDQDRENSLAARSFSVQHSGPSRLDWIERALPRPPVQVEEPRKQ